LSHVSILMMISLPSLTAVILLVVIQTSLGGNCTTSQIYLNNGESLTLLTQRCSCIEALNDQGKVFDFAINQICYKNWKAITSQTSDSICSNQEFNSNTKSCCDNVWTDTLLQLPSSCIASPNFEPSTNTTKPPPTENLSSDGNASRIPDYLAGFLIPFIVGIAGATFAYIKGWCCKCVKTLPEKKVQLKRMLTRSTTRVSSAFPTNAGDATISTTKGDIESLGVPDCIEWNNETRESTANVCVTTVP